MISVETAEARQVAKSTPSTGIPACARISGLTTTTYAMVIKVVSPASSSMRTVVLFLRRWKSSSSKLVCPGKGGTVDRTAKRRQTQKVVTTRPSDGCWGNIDAYRPLPPRDRFSILISVTYERGGYRCGEPVLRSSVDTARRRSLD